MPADGLLEGARTSADIMMTKFRSRISHWGRHKMAAIFQTTFANAFSIKISLKFVSKCPISNIPALVQMMAWRRPGDKPLSEPLMVNSLTHTCVTLPQWNICSRHLKGINIHLVPQNPENGVRPHSSPARATEVCMQGALFRVVLRWSADNYSNNYTFVLTLNTVSERLRIDTSTNHPDDDLY